MTEERVGLEKCAWHEKEIENMQKGIATLFDEVTTGKEFRGQAKIAGIVALSIFFSSFLYTYLHTQDAFDINKAQFKALSEVESRVDRIETNTLITTDRYDRLVRDLNKIDVKLSNIAEKLNNIEKDRARVLQ